MSVYQSLYEELDKIEQQDWRQLLELQVAQKLTVDGHGKMAEWQDVLAQLPDLSNIDVDLKMQLSLEVKMTSMALTNKLLLIY